MKTLKELGISPWPWIVANDDGRTAYVYSDGGNGDEVSQTCYASEDARLIASAPEMYQVLCEFVESVQVRCSKDCDQCGCAKCAVFKAKTVLKKAAGEEAGK